MQNLLCLLPSELLLNVASRLAPADLNSLLHCSRSLSTHFTDVDLQEDWLVRKYGMDAALLQACQQGAAAGPVSRLLAAPGLGVNALEEDSGSTALCIAIHGGHTAIVQLLLAAPGLDVNAADNDGATALHVACHEGHATILELLLAAPGLDVNAAINSGATALYVACQEGHATIVQLLLTTLSLDVNAADNGGATALYVACWKGRAAIAGCPGPGCECS